MANQYPQSQYTKDFQDFLEESSESRKSALLAQPGISSGSQNRFDFFRNQFGAIDELFKSQLAGQLLSGQAPTMRFVEGDNPFLKNFDLRKFEAGYTPMERGKGIRTFAPVARRSYF